MKHCVALLLGLLCAWAAADGRPAAELAPDILAREWSGLHAPPPWVVARPSVRVVTDDDVAAEARRRGDLKAEPFAVEITLSTGLVRSLTGDDPDLLAGVIAHELAHVVLGHHRTAPAGRRGDAIIGWGATRAAELDADRLAVQIAGRGGYDPGGLISLLERARDRLGNNSYWDSLGGDHPSYTERLAALDADRAALWQAALDFEVGVDLLGGGDFACAETCFRSARERFPQAPEVLCNLGCSLLMVYYRGLPPEHWVRYDLGQPMEPGYATFLPVAPRRTRGEAEWALLRALWAEAVGTLQTALQHAPDYALAQGNLGFACLVAPDGPQVPEARRWLEAAASADRATASPTLATAVANDRALVAMLAGDRAGSLGLLAPLVAPAGDAEVTLTAPALNLCLLLARSPEVGDQRQALERLQTLLPRVPAPGAQWEYAYGKYVDLCHRLGATPLPEARLRPTHPQTVAAHVICGGAKLYLGTSLVGVVKSLGGPETVIPLGRGDAMSCWRYGPAGLELVFVQDRLVRAKLGRGATATVAILRDGSAAGALAIGDAATKLDRLLPPFDGTVRLGDGKPYRYYAGARLAVLVERGQVAALSLVGARP